MTPTFWTPFVKTRLLLSHSDFMLIDHILSICDFLGQYGGPKLEFGPDFQVPAYISTQTVKKFEKGASMF